MKTCSDKKKLKINIFIFGPQITKLTWWNHSHCGLSCMHYIHDTLTYLLYDEVQLNCSKQNPIRYDASNAEKLHVP